MKQQEPPNLIFQGVLLAGLYYASHCAFAYRFDPDVYIFVWMVWSITGIATISFAIRLFRF